MKRVHLADPDHQRSNIFNFVYPFCNSSPWVDSDNNPTYDVTFILRNVTCKSCIAKIEREMKFYKNTLPSGRNKFGQLSFLMLFRAQLQVGDVVKQIDHPNARYTIAGLNQQPPPMRSYGQWHVARRNNQRGSWFLLRRASGKEFLASWSSIIPEDMVFKKEGKE